jgi:hypothetical protein
MRVPDMPAARGPVRLHDRLDYHLARVPSSSLIAPIPLQPERT